MAIDKNGKPFHPEEYDPDYPRVKGSICGLLNSCTHEDPIYEPWYPRLPVLLQGGMVQSINDFTLHEYTEWSLRKIQEASFTHSTLVVEDFLHPLLYSECWNNWPDEMYEVDAPGRLQQDITCNHSFKQLFDLVLNHEYVRCSIADRMNFNYETIGDFWLWKDSKQFTVNDVHVDFEQFDITCGLYFPNDNTIEKYGTQFWKPREEEKYLNKSLLKEDCDFLFSVPFRHNTAYFMLRGKNSWHSSPDIDREMIRNHVYGYYRRT